MNKAIFSGSIVCVLILIGGSIFLPQSLLMELASTSLLMNIIRGLIIVALLSILFTTPPRDIKLRMLVGTGAIGLFGTGMAMTMSSGMHLLDAIIFIETGLALGLEALEFNEDELAERAELLLHPEAAVPREPILRPVFASATNAVLGYIEHFRHQKWPSDIGGLPLAHS